MARTKVAEIVSMFMISFRRVLLWAITTFIVAVNKSDARLGETPIQCSERYGSGITSVTIEIEDKNHPLIPGAIHRTYEFKGWRIRVAFLELDGPAVRMEYRKIPAAGASMQIRDFEIQAILTENAPTGTSWHAAPHGNPDSSNRGLAQDAESLVAPLMDSHAWRRSDGARAQLQTGSMALRLELPAARQYEDRVKRQKDQRARESVPRF